MRWPTRPSAAMREGRVNVLAVNVTWMRVKRCLERMLQKAEEVSRRAQRSDVLRRGKRTSLICSLLRRDIKSWSDEAITVACRGSRSERQKRRVGSWGPCKWVREQVLF